MGKHFSLKNWVIAARPKTLLATLSPIIVAITITNKIYNQIDWGIIFLTVLSALLLHKLLRALRILPFFVTIENGYSDWYDENPPPLIDTCKFALKSGLVLV